MNGQKIKIESNIEEFCKKSQMSIGDDLNQPFLYKGLVISTNREILISVPQEILDKKFPSRKVNSISFNDLEKLLNLNNNPNTSQIKFIVPKVVELLNDLNLEVECSNCEGTGKCGCECGDLHNCHLCNGTGKVRSYRDETIKIGENLFSTKYIDLIFRTAQAAGEVNLTVVTWANFGENTPLIESTPLILKGESGIHFYVMPRIGNGDTIDITEKYTED